MASVVVVHLVREVLEGSWGVAAILMFGATYI